MVIFSGIQQHLFENGKNYCIFLDPVFEKFNAALDIIIGKFAEKLSVVSK